MSDPHARPTAWTAARRSFDFTGRSTREELISYFGLVLFGYLLLAVVSTALFLAFRGTGTVGSATLETVEVVIETAPMIPLLGLLARRLNDQGRSRWWLIAWPMALAWRLLGEAVEEDMTLFGLGPDRLHIIAGILLLPILILLMATGDEGDNPHGPDPRTL
jgi:uncharacterized membrane protein YhaH (DUF805 family)